MKKLVYILMMTLLVVACKSSEEKVDFLIGENIERAQPSIKKGSFELVETRIDSAYAPNDDSAVLMRMDEVADLQRKLDACNYDIELSRQRIKSRDRELASGALSPFHKAQFEDAEEDYNRSLKQRDELKEKIESKLQVIKELLQAKREFVGYKALATYRYENSMGDHVGNSYFIIDPHRRSVLYVTDKTTYERYQAVFKDLED